jgi:hypothetical protein
MKLFSDPSRRSRMTIFGKTEFFNTGRMYAKEGQLIYWATFEDGDYKGVAFCEVSRGIGKLIPMPGEMGVTTYLGEKKEVRAINHKLDKDFILACYDSYLSLERENYSIISAFQRIAYAAQKAGK